MLVIAENAYSLINGNRQNSTSVMNTRNMILSGVLVLWLILYQNFEQGSAPSLAIANPMREVTVMLLNPAKNRLIISIDVIDSAPARFTCPSALVKARV